MRELALYFQCQQGAVNRYALGGYGGMITSFDRWNKASALCWAQLQAAEAFPVDGRSCNPPPPMYELTSEYPAPPVCPVNDPVNEPVVGRVVKRSLLHYNGSIKEVKHQCVVIPAVSDFTCDKGPYWIVPMETPGPQPNADIEKWEMQVDGDGVTKLHSTGYHMAMSYMTM